MTANGGKNRPLTSLERIERFWTYVNKTPTCWLWTGATLNGYGRFGRGPGQTTGVAHRMAYEQLVGPIPAGLHLDHLCRVHACVNPAHLEPVTCRENLLRGETITARRAAQTSCLRGHAFDGENTYVAPNGCRDCRTCRREADRRYYQRKKMRATA